MEDEKTIAWNAIMLKDDSAVFRTYWSNCIIEAVRAKLHDPKNVHLLMIWPWQNEVWCPHLMWTDGIREYDFHATDVSMMGWLWHKGYIRVKPLGWCQSYIDARSSLKRRRSERRTH